MALEASICSRMAVDMHFAMMSRIQAPQDGQRDPLLDEVRFRLIL